MMKYRFSPVLAVLFGLFLMSCQQEEPVPSAPVAPLTVNDPESEAVIEQPVVVSEGSVPSTEDEPVAPEGAAEESAVVEEVEAEQLVEAVAEEGGGAPESTAVLQTNANVEHQVQAGDWLMQIARCYGADYAAVRRANPQLANPNWLLPGMTVTVPDAGSVGEVHGSPCVAEYTVALGDTWLGLAERFGTTAVILQRVNPGPLLAADKIIVPAHGVSQNP